jgi:nicotinamide mononucleotide transporter
MANALIRKIVHSDYLDIIGVALILSVCIYRNFHGTVFQHGEIQFGVPFHSLWTTVKSGAFPLGILSIIGAIFSMLSTRFISKQKNSGNMIGVATAVNSGVIDFLFGNRSAVITYPISFFLNSLSVFKWHKGAKIRPKDLQYYLIFVFGIALGFVLVYLGAHLFGGKTEHSFLAVVSITFGLSIGGNFANAFKYEETWINWIIYNIVQLIKNSMLLNIANIVKYIFYLFNAVLTLFDWKLNGDVEMAPA